MISKRTKYALKTLIYLKSIQSEGASATQISQECLIPKKFLEQILSTLKSQRYVSSALGNKGGYKITEIGSKASFADIIRFLEGPIALLPCASEYFNQPCLDCTDYENCEIRKVFKKVRDQASKILEKEKIGCK